jgi:hypothetical protein
MTAPLYRLFDTIYGDHLFTTSATERDQVIANNGYTSEGIAAYVSTTAQAGLVPLYRVSRTSGTWDRLYTTSAAERDQAVANHGYTSEGVAAYVSTTPQTGLAPLYRLVDASVGEHLFTTSTTERDALVGQGWVNEGTAAYVVSPVGPTPLPTTSGTATPTSLPTTSGTATPTSLPTTSATATPVTTGTPTGSQLLGNPGFESGAANSWKTQTNGPVVVAAGLITNNGAGESAHSGSWYAWLDGWGIARTDMLWQTVTIPATTTKATLSFWLHIDTADTDLHAYDTLTLQILDASGGVLATLHTWSNQNHNVGYAQQTFDVTAYKGRTITIKFIGTEDSSLQTSFVIDDTALSTQ